MTVLFIAANCKLTTANYFYSVAILEKLAKALVTF